jgi:predicted RNA-binding Zn-ribbon protein involved in translation (DUF1610 family)
MSKDDGLAPVIQCPKCGGSAELRHYEKFRRASATEFIMGGSNMVVAEIDAYLCKACGWSDEVRSEEFAL